MALVAEQSDAIVESRGPWATALRRLLRDRVAVFALFVFLLIVVLCLLAPAYAAWAGVDPFKSTLDAVIKVNGQEIPVMEQSTEGLGLGYTPIGPTWELGNYFLGADNQGRDVMARLLYGGLNSLLIAGAATVFTLLFATVVGLAAGFFGGVVDVVLSRILDILWAFPVYLFAISLSIVLIAQGISIGPITVESGSLWLPIFIIGIVYIPYIARPVRGQVMALRESEFVLAAIGLGVPSHRILLARHPAQRLDHAHRLRSDHDGPQHADGVRSLLPVDRCPAAGRQLGYDHPGWPDAALHPPAGGTRAGYRHRHHRACAQCAGRWPTRRPGSALQDQDRSRLMIYALLRRLGQMTFVMFGISVLVFLIFFATPGVDPAARIAGRNATPEVLAAVRKSFGFDQPMYVQYLTMMKKIFITGDLTSFVNRGWKVVPAVMDTIPVTLSLVIGAAVLWVVFALIIGIVAAATRGSWLDKLLMILGLIGISMPVYWLGEVMNLITQSRYHDTWLFSWVPPLGYKNFSDDPKGWFLTLVIPWITLSILYIGLYGRVLRASIVESLQEDYIRTARAKGLTETRILLRHALRTSLVAFVTLFGLDFGALVGGSALLTEVVFGLQGVGKLTYDALLNLDLPIIMTTVLYASFFVVMANAVVDILYMLLDPRVRSA